MSSTFWEKWMQHKYIVSIFMAFIVAINLLQGIFTELFHDEAYYWVWSRELDWGYYDQPPGIAFFIRLGTELLPGEIGVRLFVVILNALTLYLLYLLTDRKQPVLFFTLLLAAPLVHVGGILAVPDMPLVFFVAAYLYCYKRFLEEDSWVWTFWLGLAVTGMMYSKYHALMVLFFTILSYPRLLLRGKFWGIVGIATLLYVPRLYWTYQHAGFDTFMYHFFGRSKLTFSTFDYVMGEIALAGAILGVWLFYEAFYAKAENIFEKGLKWICWGIFGFLLAMTFVQHVEANWAASAFLPLFLLSYKGLSQKEHLFKRFYRIAVPTIALLMIGRLFLAWDILPVKTEFHGWKAWAKKIETMAGDCPVVFNDTYQAPSKYMFYAQGKQALSLNSAHYRHNQYDVGKYEERIQGKRIMCMSNQPFCFKMDTLKTPLGNNLYYMFIDDFHSFNKVKIEYLNENRSFKVNEVVSFPLVLNNGYDYDCHFSACKTAPAHLTCNFWNKSVWQWEYFQDFPQSLSQQVLKDTLYKTVAVKMPAKAGEYAMTFMIQYGCLYSGYQAPVIRVKVE